MGIDFTVYKGSKSGEIVETQGHRDVGPTQALVKLSHCGVCGTDEHYRHYDQGLGHEGVGTIVELGSIASTASEFKVGDRVGMGWMQRFCGYCKPCKTGRQTRCVNSEQFGTANWDQGCFATGIAWDVSALYKIPEGYPAEYAGPMMCGGATVWGPLYEYGLRAGDRIGIIGVGGLGHLAIQFAHNLGMEPVVFSGTESKRAEALKFGAKEFYATNGVEKFEGAKPLDALLITSAIVPDLTPYKPILAKFCKIFPLTISMESIPAITVLDFVASGWQVIGSAGAQPDSIVAMMELATNYNIKPQIEKFPMSKQGVVDSMQKLREGKVRYRAVLEV